MDAIIRRKIDHATQARLDGAPGADRGWRLAFSRAARGAIGMDVEFQKLTISRRSLTELLDLPPDRAFLAVLDGPGAGLGLMMLSQPVLSALIEMQTIGRVTDTVAALRRPTRTDAAMVAGVIDRALGELDTTLEQEADLVWAGGFRYASFLEDARPLALLLEEETYRVLHAEISLNGGAKSGALILALPAEGRGVRPASVAALDALVSGPAFTTALGAQVMQADCVLEAVIARAILPLQQVMGLKPGDILPLPSAALDGISLETRDGRLIATGKLGQNRGLRALRVAVTSAAKDEERAVPPRVAPASTLAGPEQTRQVGAEASVPGSLVPVPVATEDWRAAG